ncbi:uncharacterized protein TNIN_68541 [Trichonephila inaurata madagascariensis]|uniref:Uncharacterized protein n=1 Tax=Trichonephila inaurata madagascariensis TaxID=2747483 RepID=A0A8X7C6C1_9ARAC|nr:uncharacterized protein TNIN_68541 [Trichonephila inaurata madagascariensis]
MDSGLGVRWPLSPFATALAAGALVAFCVAFWKKGYFPRRRDSAPASTSQNINNSETSSGLSKSNSDPSLNVLNIDNKPTFSAISNIPSISNFANSDGKLVSSKIRLPEISNLELRPLNFNYDNIRNLPKFTKLYNLPISQKTSYSKCGTIFGLKLHELILRENLNLFGSIYSHIRPLSKNFCPFIGHYQTLKSDTSSQILNPVYVPSSALTKPYSGRTFEGHITKSFKSLVREEDFYSFYRNRCGFDLKKRNKVNSNLKNKIEDSFKRKDIEQISEQLTEKETAIPNTNSSGVDISFNKHDIGIRKRKNLSPCSKNQTVQNINSCETTKHFEESDIEHPVLKYDRKEDISSNTSSNSRDFSFTDNDYLESRKKSLSPIENETIEKYHPFEIETIECISENTSSLAPSKENTNLGKCSNDRNISSDKNNLRNSPSFETDLAKKVMLLNVFRNILID